MMAYLTAAVKSSIIRFMIPDFARSRQAVSRRWQIPMMSAKELAKYRILLDKSTPQTTSTPSERTALAAFQACEIARKALHLESGEHVAGRA